MDALRRTGAEPLRAWLVTGPAGHLWSVLADAVVILAREGPWRRRRRHDPGR